MDRQQVCTNSGTSVGGEDLYCAGCGTKLSSKSRVFDGGAVSGKISGDQNQLAGMWRRAGSLLIDSVLIALIVKVLTALGLVVLLLFSELPAAPSPLAMGAVLLFLLLLYLVVPAGYDMYFWTTSGQS